MGTRDRFMWGMLGLTALSGAYAQDGDLAEGRKLYEKECIPCHGDNATETTGQRAIPRWQVARAISPHLRPSVTDIGETQVAVAPPFGPHLRGVFGRVAGSVEGFQYSENFLNSLKGMIWDEGSLDVWLTSTQSWVQGVTMYYSQKNPEIRRKIILYLKESK
jgi:cytochrome c2